ncbi:MAG: hypothetical protein AAF911_15475 [Planctomycetota bacterium]
MSVREFLNNNSAVATIVAVVLLVMALGVIIWQNQGPQPRQLDVFYYDLNTQEVFVDDLSRVVPFDRGNGAYEFADGPRGSAVRAMIYTCGDPEEIKEGMTLAEIEAAGGFIAYLERFTPQMLERQARIDAGESISYEDYEVDYDSVWVSTPEGQTWVNQNSEAGTQVIQSGLQRCGNVIPKLCRP